MTFPEGVQVVTVTLETPLGASGVAGVFSGCQLEIDRKVIHAASGQTLYPNPIDVTPATPGDPITFDVPFVDQDGFVDASGGAITGWHYVLSGAVQFGALKAQRFTPKPFQVLVGETGPISLDLVPDGVAVPATVAPSPAGSTQGPTGLTANGALSGHRLVVPTGTQVEYADNTDLTDIGKPVFLTTGAASDGQPVTLVARGLVVEPTWAWAPGLIYAGTNGLPTQTPPTTGYLRVIGEALSATTVWVDPRPPFILT